MNFPRILRIVGPWTLGFFFTSFTSAQVIPKVSTFPESILLPAAWLVSDHPISYWLDSLTSYDSGSKIEALYEYDEHNLLWRPNRLNPNLSGMILPIFQKSQTLDPSTSGFSSNRVGLWLKSSNEAGPLRLIFKNIKISHDNKKKSSTPSEKSSSPQLPNDFTDLLFRVSSYLKSLVVTSEFQPLFLTHGKAETRIGEGDLVNFPFKLEVAINPKLSGDPYLTEACNKIRAWILSRQITGNKNPETYKSQISVECSLSWGEIPKPGEILLFRLPIPLFSETSQTFPLKSRPDTRSVSVLQSLRNF